MKWSTDNDFGTETPIPNVTSEDMARVAHMVHTRVPADLIPDVMGMLFGATS